MRWLTLLFILVPLTEAWILIQLGGWLGWLNTVALVIFTGLVGGWLARMEGLRTWRRWREALAEGRMPDEGLLSGLLLLAGGLLLITPGVLTDIAGLLLLLPPTRRRFADWLRARLESRFDPAVAPVRIVHYQLGDFAPPARPREILDAEFEVHEHGKR